MDKEELIRSIRRNKLVKQEAVVLISDFLVISKKEAEEIYNEEFSDVDDKEIRYQRSLKRGREYYHRNKEEIKRRKEKRKRACI